MSEIVPAARRPRVLVVEDQRHVRTMLGDLLAIWGFDADQAMTASEGWERLRSDRYDVLLADLRLPGMSGLELVERVRERDATLGVILITASAGDFEWARHRLRFTVLRKPLGLSRLKAALDHALHCNSCQDHADAPTEFDLAPVAGAAGTRDVATVGESYSAAGRERDHSTHQ
jgi:DNA-binding response OmpR family regulator